MNEKTMTQDLDVNKMAAEFASANLERMLEAASSGLRKSRTRVRAKLTKTYLPYLERLLERYSKSKSFFVRTEAVPLYSFYVPMDLATQRRRLIRPGIREVAGVSRQAVLVGTGGCGKTMLMRHFLISCMAEGEKTPVYIELRQLNHEKKAVVDAILFSLVTNGLDVDHEFVEVALKAGSLCLLLDGFDELEPSKKEGFAREILQLSERFPHNWLVLSSRPDPKLQGWLNYVQFEVQPLTVESAIDLVDKLPFDDPVKDRFVRDLKDDLFARHSSFLSNPLLLSIMLLTYKDVAHIPDKLTLFYGQAYESLFQKHDALKGGFQRPRLTKLDIQDFSRVFAGFCVQSYDKRKLSFSRTESLGYIRGAQELSGVPVDSEAFLGDALQAVCLLIEDGLLLAYAHRSFQEYFVARFIAAAPPSAKTGLIDRFASSVDSDSVMRLLYEMDPWSVEEYLILPTINRLKEAIGFKRSVGVTHFVRFLKLMFEDFEVLAPVDGGEPGLDYGQADTAAGIRDGELFAALGFIVSLYRPRKKGELMKEVQGEGLQLVEAILEDADGRRSVRTNALKTTSAVVRALRDSSSLWGMQLLAEVIDIGAEVEASHAEAEESLHRVLGIE